MQCLQSLLLKQKQMVLLTGQAEEEEDTKDSWRKILVQCVSPCTFLLHLTQVKESCLHFYYTAEKHCVSFNCDN